MTLHEFKVQLNNVFDDDLHTRQWHNIVDWTIMGLILVSTVQVFLSTFDSIAERYSTALLWVDWITQIFFTVEVTLRIWNADMLDPKYKGFMGRVRYCFSFYGLIDVLSTYPFYINMFTAIPYSLLKVFRIARLLRVFRYMHSFKMLSAAIRSKKSELLVSLQFLTIVTVILSFILYFVEHEAQPEVYENGWRSVVWAFAQYIQDPGGFADMPPITLTGQIISVIVGILGIAIFAVPAGLIGSGFTEVMEEEQKDKELKNNITRIAHSFKFDKDQQHTNLFHVPRYKPVSSIVSRKFMSEQSIIETIEKSDCFHLYNLADSVNRSDRPDDKLVVVNYKKNRPYGCCIDRKSKVTIVATSGYTEPIGSWYAYHVAKLGGFNFVSREVELDPDNPVTYYTINNVDDCPNMRFFLDDIDSLSNKEDSWVIFLLQATGPQIGDNRRPHQLHFCFGPKGDATYSSPEIRIKDKELFEQMYVDMDETMKSVYELYSDKNKYYGVNAKTNPAAYLKCPNNFTLRIESIVSVFSTNFLAVAKTISEVFNRNFEPGVEKPIPPEMLERRKGHDFGMDDYVD